MYFFAQGKHRGRENSEVNIKAIVSTMKYVTLLSLCAMFVACLVSSTLPPHTLPLFLSPLRHR